MPSLCDVNVLLALCVDRHVHFERAHAWLNTIERPGEIGICRIGQLGLLRLLNSPAAMLGEPLDVAAVWDAYDALMEDERFRFRAEPPNLESAMRDIMPARLISPKLWQDAYLAAFAIASGATLVTFDAAFRQFTGLGLLLLQ